MMINNPVGLTSGHVDTKSNIIADKISRWKKETNKLLEFHTLVQEFPQLKCCRRFHPSNELISWISDALLSEKMLRRCLCSRFFMPIFSAGVWLCPLEHL